MEFGSFDDDFFEVEESKQKSLVVNSDWTAHRSEPGWFHKVCEQAATENVAFSVKHLHANHLYCTGRHLEAAHVFSELIETMPTGNHQREVSEGLARSLLKSGDFKNALEAAKQFERSCKSTVHFASFHSLCAEIFRKSLDHENELVHLKQTIKVHPTNADLWLRLAECYSLSCNANVYSVPFNLSKTKDATWYAAASLVRVEIILKSLAGREAAGILKKKRNEKLRNLVQPITASLPQNFVSIAQEALSRDVYHLEPQIQDDNEFIDLGSSKQAKALECDDEDSGTDSQQPEVFEKHWFSFSDSIQDINLYSPENTHGCDA